MHASNKLLSIVERCKARCLTTYQPVCGVFVIFSFLSSTIATFAARFVWNNNNPTTCNFDGESKPSVLLLLLLLLQRFGLVIHRTAMARFFEFLPSPVLFAKGFEYYWTATKGLLPVKFTWTDRNIAREKRGWKGTERVAGWALCSCSNSLNYNFCDTSYYEFRRNEIFVSFQQ